VRLSVDEIFEAALGLPKDKTRILLDLLMDSIPPDGVMSTDDPGFHEELRRRMNDLSDLIPWSEVRDKK
jgi:hypothetical protein